MDTYKTVLAYFLTAILCAAIYPSGAHKKVASHAKQGSSSTVSQAKTISSASEPQQTLTGSAGNQVVSDFVAGQVSTGSAKKTSDGWKTVKTSKSRSEAGSEWRQGEALERASERRQRKQKKKTKARQKRVKGPKKIKGGQREGASESVAGEMLSERGHGRKSARKRQGARKRQREPPSEAGRQERPSEVGWTEA